MPTIKAAVFAASEFARMADGGVLGRERPPLPAPGGGPQLAPTGVAHASSCPDEGDARRDDERARSSWKSERVVVFVVRSGLAESQRTARDVQLRRPRARKSHDRNTRR